ncbi:lymphocyte function-associated antigen 3 isoform X2 [Clupea harengus]|uniref:Lymphocyte function-associated antigen 3 isoform X2 n=1 Tax=Clupea harengus TaxID=7950 RepID=A0A6P8ETB8_CLUHA|nr:lymphocyte function-associated antigen 3 isoform X2 [Clupea harengus]
MRNTHLLHLLVFILMKCYVDFQSGELTVKRLTTGDDGVYESTAIVNGKNQYSKHELQVIAGVPQPKVTCKQADPESEETTLLCGVEVDTPVRYRWRGPTVYDHLGSELRLGKQEDLDSVYTCIVKNEISEKQATFTLRDCQSGGISPGIIAVVILSAICALCLLILIPLLVCRRKQKLLKKNPAHKQADVENGENKNLLSSGQATNKNTGGKKESRGLYRAVHLNRQSGAIEDAENEERSSFSLRATLPSHAKLRPPRAGDEQANGSFGAKDRNSPDRSTASGLQQEDQSAESKPVPVERVTLDQKAVVVRSQLHGKHLASAVISHSSSSAEEPDMQLNAVNCSRRNSENDGRSNLNPEGVSEEMKPYHSHNITVTTEGKDRRECCEEEDNVSDTERGADMTSERGVAEEKDGNDEQQTASENGQEEESSKQEKEDSGSLLKNQENHEMVVEEGSVDKERNGERVPPDQTEEEEANDREHKEELPEVEQAIQEHLKEDAPKDEIKNVQDDQDEAAMDPEPERTGNEGESGIVHERERTAEEEEEEVEEEEDDDITTKKQPLGENEQGSSIPEPQEMMEPEVQKDLTGDEGEQELHVSEGLEEGRTGEHDGVEDGEMGPERTCHDVREGERERKGEDEQGDGVEVDVDTNHREEEEEGQDGEMAGQQQDELRREERQEPDEETVGVNSELEEQLLKQASNTSLKEPQIDCQDVSVSDEMNGEESENKSENEGTKSNTQVEEKKQEEPNPLKQGEDHSIPKEELFSLEEQGSCLPEDQIDCPDVSVSDEVNGEESEMKLESVGTEYNTPLEEKKQEKQNPLKQGEDQSIPKGAAVEEQDSCLPEDQRTDEVISDENETQDDHELDGKTETVDNQATQDQAKEEEFKQEQTEQDQHQNDTNSPHEHEQAGKPEKKDEENNTEIEPENESSQEQEKEASELTKTESDGERDMEPSGQLQSEEHLEHKDEEHLEHKDEEHLEHKDEEHLEHKDEEQGKEEDIGQPDNTQLQAQPLKEEQHVDINLEEGKDNKTISDSDGEKEGKGQKKEDSKLEEEGEAGETDTDQVQEEAHPAVSNEEVIAMDEKEHSVTEDETVESVSDVREAEKLYPTEEEDVERKQERTQKDGQQDDQNNSVPDDNKEKGDQNKSVPDDNMEKEDQNKSVPDDNKEKEDQNNSVPDDNKEKGDQNNSVPDDNKEKEDKKYNEVNPNRESDKETLLEEERGDTEVHQGRTEGEQHHTEVPGQLQNEQKQVENHDDDDDDDYEEERMSDGEESVEGKALEDQMKHQMERPNNKSDTCENNKDGRDVVPEKNGNRNDYQAEKEGREKVEIKCEEMHQDDMAKQDRASY